jgi:3-dehydroquinate synthase
MGEVIKYGCIKSSKLFERLENENAKDFIEDLIYQCVDIKRQVVEEDEKEMGQRALLNFGHTCGHAIEKLWNFETISHGEAVGIGMAMIARAGENASLTKKGTSDKIIALLKKYNLKTSDTHTVSEIVSAMSADKKRTGDGIKFAMLKEIGQSYIQPVKNEDISKLFGVNV